MDCRTELLVIPLQEEGGQKEKVSALLEWSPGTFYSLGWKKKWIKIDNERLMFKLQKYKNTDYFTF